MPSRTKKQAVAMRIAAAGKSNIGIPQAVGKEFVRADKKRKQTVQPPNKEGETQVSQGWNAINHSSHQDTMIIPIGLDEANIFISDYHRHSAPVPNAGNRFAIGLMSDSHLVGVAIVSRPSARLMCDGVTAEVRRLCVSPEAPRNACSMLYGRCWRIWQQMGGRRMITYTLQAESGASLRGAGWKIMGEVKGNRQWSCKSRPRSHKEIYREPKFRWEVAA
jgi:hypothetical protein